MAVGGSQVIAQRSESVAVARRGSVGRQVELVRNLLERELAPDFEDEHFALLGRKAMERVFDRPPPLFVLDRRPKPAR